MNLNCCIWFQELKFNLSRPCVEPQKNNDLDEELFSFGKAVLSQINLQLSSIIVKKMEPWQVEAFILAVERNEAEEKAINNKLLHFFDELCSSASVALTF